MLVNGNHHTLSDFERPTKRTGALCLELSFVGPLYYLHVYPPSTTISDPVV